MFNKELWFNNADNLTVCCNGNHGYHYNTRQTRIRIGIRSETDSEVKDSRPGAKISTYEITQPKHRAIKEALPLIRWRHKLFRWVDKKQTTNAISSRLKSI